VPFCNVSTWFAALIFSDCSSNREARERAAQDEAAKRERHEAARKWREKREAGAAFYRQIKAAADREAKRKRLVRVAIGVGAFLAFVVFIGVMAAVAAR
jgi:Flp pilus assembly protein TadB